MDVEQPWTKLSRQGSWWWVAHQMRNGDLYHALTLLPAFIEAHGPEHPVRLVIDRPAQADVARLFDEHLEEVILETDLPKTREEWGAFYRESGLPTFGLDTPILVHAFLNQEAFRVSDRAAAGMGGTPMEVYKHTLRLVGEVEPSPAASRPEFAADADRLCREASIRPGGSVILFPYAQSLRVDALAHFEHLAAELKRRGLDVFTSVAPGEIPVPGTRAVFIPFHLLPEVAEWAGWVIGARSGVADIVSPARCRKTWIYPNLFKLRLWNLDALGLGRDATEILFCFPLGTPEAFSQAVFSEEAVRPPRLRARGLPDFVGAGPGAQASSHTVSFADVQRDPQRVTTIAHEAVDRLRDGASLLAVRDLPPSTHERWAELRTDFLRLLREGVADGPVRLYVCGDYIALGAYQEIDPAALRGGYYDAAQRWHALFVTANGPLERFLPPSLHPRVTSLGAVSPDAAVPFAEIFGSRSHELNILHDKPLSIGGFELTEGWEGAEPWGVWSRGRRCILRFALEAPATGPLRLVLHAMAAVSEAFRAIRFAVHVNGVFVTDAEVALGGAPPALDLLIPAEVTAGARLFWVTLDFEELRTPEQQGAAPDGRLLGLGVHFAMLSTAP